MNRILFLGVLCAICASPPAISADAASPDSAADALGSEWVPVDPALLAEMRGGMQLPSGLSLSFGIDRLVYVNGDLVASTHLHIADIAQMTREDVAALVALNQGTVIQIGSGNVITPGQAANGLVIQNTLDNQDIRSLTTLNISVNNLNVLRGLSLQDALQSMLVGSRGP